MNCKIFLPFYSYKFKNSNFFDQLSVLFCCYDVSWFVALFVVLCIEN